MRENGFVGVGCSETQASYVVRLVRGDMIEGGKGDAGIRLESSVYLCAAPGLISGVLVGG